MLARKEGVKEGRTEESDEEEFTYRPTFSTFYSETNLEFLNFLLFLLLFCSCSSSSSSFAIPIFGTDFDSDPSIQPGAFPSQPHTHFLPLSSHPFLDILQVKPAPTNPLSTEFRLQQMLILYPLSLFSFIAYIGSNRIPPTTYQICCTL